MPHKLSFNITIAEQYAKCHRIQDLLTVKEIIHQKHKRYIDYFDQHMNCMCGHFYNMFIMKQEMFDDYCNFLFSILFELENKINLLELDKYQSRVFGFVSERLLDVWLNANKIKYVECPVLLMKG